MHKSAPVIILAILILLPLPLQALPLVGVEAAVGAWRQSPSGWVSYESDDRLDLEDVLNYDDETRFIGRLKINMPPFVPNLYLMVSPLKFEETGIADDFYRFGGIIIVPGISFESKLVVNQYDIGLYYEIPLLEKASLRRLNIEVGINTKIVDAEATIKQDTFLPGIEIRETEKETVVAPMVYLGISVRPTHRFAFEGEFRGLSYSDTDFFSLIGRLKVNAWGPLFVAGGYRYDTSDSTDWDLEFDADFAGPFLETGFQF